MKKVKLSIESLSKYFGIEPNSMNIEHLSILVGLTLVNPKERYTWKIQLINIGFLGNIFLTGVSVFGDYKNLEYKIKDKDKDTSAFVYIN